MNKRIIITASLALVLIFSLASAQAASVDQTLNLNSGWNAVFLEVEPQSTAPADVFAPVIANVVSTWMWNPNTGTVEFIQNPAQMVPEGPHMLAYFPGDASLTNLHAVHGNTAYLIQMNAADTLTVTGEPLPPKSDWKPNSFNFVGFHLKAGQEPFYENFFESSPAHAGQAIYALDNGSGTWQEINPVTTPMVQGEAFWIYCKGSSTFTGPLSVQLEQGEGLPFGTALGEQEITIINNDVFNPKSVTLAYSTAPVDWLYYWEFDPANEIAGWYAFPPALPIDIGAGESQKIRLAVRRASLAPETSYEANVEVTDGQGSRIVLPASVTGVDFYGLWIGDATITKVSEVRVSDVPVPTGSEFSFRLIIHNADNGEVNLLKEVVQMWQEGTWKPDPDHLGKLIVDQPGAFVLLTDDSLIPYYSGSAMRDGQLVGRRISSSAFGFVSPKLMTGNFMIDSSLTGTIALLKNDTTNPFLHKYHPDHMLEEQSYDVTRNITMTFSDTDDQGRLITGVPVLSWGSSDVGGIYRETISGLSKPGNPIYLEGTFQLHKVNSVRCLTTASPNNCP